MRFRLYIMALLLLLVLMPFAIVQSGAEESSNGRHIPRLADIMSAAQLRHIKLWFAGESRIGNSPLTNFGSSGRA